jgi:hypothetical protein
MKKFMSTTAPVKDLGGGDDENESLLMVLNSNAAGSDDSIDAPADSLAYGQMRFCKDGTVMSESEIRDLRQRQGYCLTCAGDPVKLFEIKRSKMNPLYQKKEPIQVANQSLDGVCLKCSPLHQQNTRRGSVAATGPANPNVNMLPGTVQDMAFRQPRRFNSIGASTNAPSSHHSVNGMGMSSSMRGNFGPGAMDMTGISAHSVGGMTGGAEFSPKKATGKVSRSKSPTPGSHRQLVSPSNMHRSNSDDSIKVGRSLIQTCVPLKGASSRRLGALRRSKSSDESSLDPAPGNTMGLVALPPPKSALLRSSKSNDFDDDALTNAVRMPLTTAKNTTSHSSSDGFEQDMTAPLSTKGKGGHWANLADYTKKLKHGGLIEEVERAKIPKRAESVDSNGFLDDIIVDEPQIGFHSSFMHMGANAFDGIDPTSELLSIQNSENDSDEENDELLLRNNAEGSKTIEREHGKTEDAPIQAKSLAAEKSLSVKSLRQSLASEKSLSEKSLNLPLVSTTQWEGDFVFWHSTLSSLVKTTEERFGALEMQMTAILQQQTLLLQQHASILHVLSNLKLSGPPVGPEEMLASPAVYHESQAPALITTEQQTTDVKDVNLSNGVYQKASISEELMDLEPVTTNDSTKQLENGTQEMSTEVIETTDRSENDENSLHGGQSTGLIPSHDDLHVPRNDDAAKASNTEQILIRSSSPSTEARSESSLSQDISAGSSEQGIVDDDNAVTMGPVVGEERKGERKARRRISSRNLVEGRSSSPPIGTNERPTSERVKKKEKKKERAKGKSKDKTKEKRHASRPRSCEKSGADDDHVHLA